jgi:thioredoxin reductase (NADPH)
LDILLEKFLIYSAALILLLTIVIGYLFFARRKTKSTFNKIDKAVEDGLHEPVSLHPVIDPDICLGSGACVEACPEKDILGLVNGYAKVVNAANCVGHGACFHACPVQAITLFIGTEKRGVELPHVSPKFETNVPGIFIAGELGGMGLIKNSIEQGKQAMANLISKIAQQSSLTADYDAVIIGAGPAGIAATLTAEKNKIKYLTLEQDSLGGTVFNFPRAKVIMTSAMELPLYGKVKLSETSKTELLNLWNSVLQKNNIKINENEKVESVEKTGECFSIKTSKKSYTAKGVLIAAGRRGSPRKLGIPGEEKEKVAYRLLEPELIKNKKVFIAGGGDSAIEAALLISDEGNDVTLSYRGDSFNRLKPKNLQAINEASSAGKVKVILISNLMEIKDESVLLKIGDEIEEIKNDLVFIFAGGELPSKFLEKIGINITKKFGEAILKH